MHGLHMKSKSLKPLTFTTVCKDLVSFTGLSKGLTGLPLSAHKLIGLSLLPGTAISHSSLTIILHML